MGWAIAVVLFTGYALTAALAAQSTPSVETLLTRHFEGRGGVDAWQQLKAYEIQATAQDSDRLWYLNAVFLPTAPVLVEQRSRLGEKEIHLESRLQGKVYHIHTLQPGGLPVQRREAARAPRFLSLFELDQALLQHRGAAGADAVELDRWQGLPAARLALTLPDGLPVTLWFSAGDARLLAIETQEVVQGRLQPVRVKVGGALEAGAYRWPRQWVYTTVGGGRLYRTVEYTAVHQRP